MKDRVHSKKRIENWEKQEAANTAGWPTDEEHSEHPGAGDHDDLIEEVEDFG